MKTEEVKEKKFVQGSWISQEEAEFLKSEARRRGLRSATTLATRVLKEFIKAEKLKQAQELIQSEAEATNGKEEKGISKRSRSGKGRKESEAGIQNQM